MKLEFAIAFSHAPKLLILDEATSGLDPIFRDEDIGTDPGVYGGRRPYGTVVIPYYK